MQTFRPIAAAQKALARAGQDNDQRERLKGTAVRTVIQGVILAAAAAWAACGAGGPALPADILAQSWERFDEVETLIIRSELEGPEDDPFGDSTSEMAYRENSLVYSLGSFGGSENFPNGVVETLVLPPDFFYATYRGDWFVERDYLSGDDVVVSPFFGDPAGNYRRMTCTNALCGEST